MLYPTCLQQNCVVGALESSYAISARLTVSLTMQQIRSVTASSFCFDVDLVPCQTCIAAVIRPGDMHWQKMARRCLLIGDRMPMLEFTLIASIRTVLAFRERLVHRGVDHRADVIIARPMR